MTVIADAIDLSTIQILQSPDVHDWPVTTAITRIEFRTNNFLVDFTKKDGPDRWPDATTPGWDGPLQYTIWVVLPQQKLTCGCIQLWHGRDGVGGPFSNGAKDWWFRVGPMAPIQPQPGDKVGFFLTAGDARLRTDATSVHERSNIVVVTVPASDTAVLTFPAVAPAPTPGPDPAPTPGPAPGPTPGPAPVATVDFSAVLARIDKLENDLKAAVKALDVRLKALEQRPFPIYVAADGSKLVPQ